MHEPFDSSATWKDLKQLAWSVMLVLPFIALGTFGLSAVIGVRRAVWAGVGLTAFVIAILSLIVAMCLVGSYGFEFFVRWRQRARKDEHLTARRDASAAR